MCNIVNIGVSGATGKVGSLVIQHLIKHHSTTLSYSYAPNIPASTLEELCRISDVVIDFSTPSNVLPLLSTAQKYKTKLVIGTTGLSGEHMLALQEAARIIPIIYSANMSIGINILRSMIDHAAKSITSNFTSAILDIHHQHKKDAPSGTAIMLATSLQNHGADIAFSNIRMGNIFGIHEVILDSADETIVITHTAKNRDMFALAAIKAAIWLSGQSTPSLYDIMDAF